MLPACPPQIPEPRRLAWALLFSLLLHTLLLLLVRFAPPSWQALAGKSSTLNVILATPPATPPPSPVAAAGKEGAGAARTGIRDDTAFPEQALSSSRRTPAEQTRTSIPENLNTREILTMRKPAQADILESPPELLATQQPPIAQPEAVDKPYAPAPSVAKSEMAASPPPEKLVAAEPVAGDRQEKIVLATPPLPPPAKPEAEERRPAKHEEAQPEKVAETRTESPRPAEPESPRPPAIEQPATAEPGKSQPEKIDVPPPPTAKAPEPRISEEPRAEEAKTAKTEAVMEQPPAPAPKSGAFRTAPAYRIPDFSSLGITPIRKLPEDDSRKIRFGERGKTVSLRESDIRYAMYVESVRLKLQRIGAFNYPAAAARNNLSGTLSAIITLRADGSLEEFRVVQPSAYEVLDQGAERIVRMSAPFSPLPDNIRRETEILNIRINWSFSKAEQSLD